MKRTIFIGQAMPRVKTNPHDWPSLNKWLYSIGLSDSQISKNFLYSALVDYFPGAKNGSHKVPSTKEVYKEKDRLTKTLIDFNPKIIVPVGRLSISYCLNEKIKPLNVYVGNIYVANPYLVLNKKRVIIPLPHPSGASTWHHNEENQILLTKALDNLKNKLNEI
jgi:uracil-DNA glycosylase